MTSVKPLLCLLVISFLAASAFAAGDESSPAASNASVQKQGADPTLFGRSAVNQPASPDLFFLKTQPRLDLSGRPARSRTAALYGSDCYKMRMYKVKRKERLADGENGLLGYTTCELASNYQVHSAVAHVQTPEGGESPSDASQK
jgi:hypothetical protein